jgi:tyrosine-protein kinase
MTFEQYWIVLVRRWRLIVICFLLVGAGAAVGSKLITPLYQSTTLVQVAVGSASNQSDYVSLLASDQLVQTEAILATSDPVLREVTSHYKGLTVEQLSKEVTATPKLNTQLFEIDVLDPSPTRAAALANDIAATLVRQQIQMTQQSNLLLVQAAQPSRRPAQPNNLLNASAGLLIGLLLGMFLALLVEKLDTHVRTSETITQLLDWPILATIWRTGPDEKVVNPTGHDANIESYRILRTNIGFSGVDKPMHSLMVTGALSHEGRSSIAANLAIFMAKAGKNTLLIDADLRRPTLGDKFGLSPDKMGLSNAVLAMSILTATNSPSQLRSSTLSALQSNAPTTDLSLEPFVHSVGIPNLWVMPSGPLPPNPPELLDSKAMHLLLAEIANFGVEIVIFDTPPLLGLSDASILASMVDGTLVVVDITRAKKRSLEQLKAVLVQAGAHVIGCVVNRQHRNPKDTIYYYYHTDDQNGARNQSTKNINSSGILINNLNASEDTIRLARFNTKKNGQSEK